MTAVSCVNNAADVEIGPYTVSVIEKNIYHIQDYNSSNPAGETFDAEGNKTHFNNCSDMYLIVGKEKALLIDLSNNIRWADNAAESLRQLVAERTEGKPLTITFTHNHGDHTGMIHAYMDDPEVWFKAGTVSDGNVTLKELEDDDNEKMYDVISKGGFADFEQAFAKEQSLADGLDTQQTVVSTNTIEEDV